MVLPGRSLMGEMEPCHHHIAKSRRFLLQALCEAPGVTRLFVHFDDAVADSSAEFRREGATILNNHIERL